jgi:hypothetical protein
VDKLSRAGKTDRAEPRKRIEPTPKPDRANEVNPDPNQIEPGPIDDGSAGGGGTMAGEHTEDGRRRDPRRQWQRVPRRWTAMRSTKADDGTIHEDGGVTDDRWWRNL